MFVFHNFGQGAVASLTLLDRLSATSRHGNDQDSLRAKRMYELRFHGVLKASGTAYPSHTDKSVANCVVAQSSSS